MTHEQRIAEIRELLGLYGLWAISSEDRRKCNQALQSLDTLAAECLRLREDNLMKQIQKLQLTQTHQRTGEPIVCSVCKKPIMEYGLTFVWAEGNATHLRCQPNSAVNLQSQLAALKLANEKLVELVGRVSNHVIFHLPTCGNGDCTCGLSALRAEIERVKGGK